MCYRSTDCYSLYAIDQLIVTHCVTWSAGCYSLYAIDQLIFTHCVTWSADCDTLCAMDQLIVTPYMLLISWRWLTVWLDQLIVTHCVLWSAGCDSLCNRMGRFCPFFEFSNVKDLLNYHVVKQFLIFLFCPLEFFENRTFKWVAFIGFGSNHFCYFFSSFLNLGEPQTTWLFLKPKISHPTVYYWLAGCDTLCAIDQLVVTNCVQLISWLWLTVYDKSAGCESLCAIDQLVVNHCVLWINWLWLTVYYWSSGCESLGSVTFFIRSIFIPNKIFTVITI